jgi:hypothetical protein
MREGIYQSIQELTGHGQSTVYHNRIKAIVLLSDSEWNDYGDPLAGWDGTSVATSLGYYEEERDPLKLSESGRSQWTAYHNFDEDTNVTKSDPRQNLAIYAKNHDIIVFPIAYFKKGVIIPTALDNRFQNLADTTGGVYYKADSGEALKGVFEDIGRRLRQEAGVNTSAVLNFTYVKLNNVNVSGADVFDYIYQEDQSTFIKKWNTSTEYNTTEDQTADWYDDLKLNFDIGTMYIGDSWIGNFTLRSKQVGIVEFLGYGSEISFNIGENITPPQISEYSQPIYYGHQETQTLVIEYYSVSDSFHNTYQINYSGEKPVVVKLYYKKEGGGITDPYHQFTVRTYTCTDGCTHITGEGFLSRRNLQKGNYTFKIESVAADALPGEMSILKILESDAPGVLQEITKYLGNLGKIQLR